MTKHPETEIVAYARGELEPVERARIGAHLAACAECRAVSDSFRELLDALTISAPIPPPVDWVRYRADLRAKIAARSARRVPAWWQPVPLAASAALAGVLIFLAVGDLHRAKPADLGAVEEAVFGQRLEVVRQQTLLEKIDLFEDLDVIRDLGPLAANQDG